MRPRHVDGTNCKHRPWTGHDHVHRHWRSWVPTMPPVVPGRGGTLRLDADLASHHPLSTTRRGPGFDFKDRGFINLPCSASEEYLGMWNSINDVRFFLSGPGTMGPYTNNAENIALVPGTTRRSINGEQRRQSGPIYGPMALVPFPPPERESVPSSSTVHGGHHRLCPGGLRRDLPSSFASAMPSDTHPRLRCFHLRRKLPEQCHHPEHRTSLQEVWTACFTKDVARPIWSCSGR